MRPSRSSSRREHFITIITDTAEDTIEVLTGGDGTLYIDVTEGRSESQVIFYRDDEDEAKVRQLRDALNGWLGDETPRVAASTISPNEALLRLAVVHGLTAEFSYSKGDGGVVERRRLQPHDVREIKGNLLFTGHDPDRDDVRAYRVDRVLGTVEVR